MAFVLSLLLAATTTGDIVTRFFPPELKVRNGFQVRANELQHTALTADLDHSGRQLIVALYTNDTQGMLEILSPQGGGSVLDEGGLPGGNPYLSLIDVDGDGRKEIVATVTQHRGGSPTWLYRWNGTALERLHRTESDDAADSAGKVVDDAIIDPTFIDVDGDGKPEIIEHNASRETDESGDEHWVAVYEVLTWSDGKIASMGDATALRMFERGKGSPGPVSVSFTSRESGAQRLLVVNGTPEGTARVASAIVKLNGDAVLSEHDFNETVARREVPVTVAKGDNTLSVEVRGAPAGQVTILILPK